MRAQPGAAAPAGRMRAGLPSAPGQGGPAALGGGGGRRSARAARPVAPRGDVTWRGARRGGQVSGARRGAAVGREAGAPAGGAAAAAGVAARMRSAGRVPAVGLPEGGRWRPLGGRCLGAALT